MSSQLPLPIEETKSAESGLQHIEDCKHEHIEEGSCIECGLSISGSGSHMQQEEEYSISHQRVTQASTMGFNKDLDGKDLPPEVKAWVLKMVASAPKKVARMASRERRLFAYVYIAHATLGYDIDPEKVAGILGIHKSQLAESIRLASGISPTVLPQSHNNTQIVPMMVLSPISYLDSTLPILKLEEHKAAIQSLMEEALEKEPLLYEEKPKWMAVAFIKYFLEKNKQSVVKFHEKFDMTATSVKSCLTKIQAVLK